MNKNSIMIIAVVLIVLAGVGGFVVGMQYAKSNPRQGFEILNSNGNGSGFRRFGGATGQNQNLRGVRGQVVSVGNGTMTVKLADGSTRLVVVSGSTNYLKTDKASQSDVNTGDTITVLGTQNSDGSITAQDVQVGGTNLLRGMLEGQPQPTSTNNQQGAGY